MFGPSPPNLLMLWWWWLLNLRSSCLACVRLRLCFSLGAATERMVPLSREGCLWGYGYSTSQLVSRSMRILEWLWGGAYSILFHQLLLRQRCWRCGRWKGCSSSLCCYDAVICRGFCGRNWLVDDGANDLWVFVQMVVQSRPLNSCSMPSLETVCVRPSNLSRKDDISPILLKIIIIFLYTLTPPTNSCLLPPSLGCSLGGNDNNKYLNSEKMEQFLKLLIIGDSGVGKSCILSRYCDNKFTDAFYNTIGVDFKTKTQLVDGKKCKLQIWDTAGQERFRTITSNYYKGAHGILIVFDVTSRESLKNVNFWLQEIEKFGNAHSSVILIGNKSDLAGKREVTEDEALDFAKKHNLDFIECSAFNALNISLVFEAIVRKVIRERGKRQQNEMETPVGSSKSLQKKTNLANSQQEKGRRLGGNCC